MSNVCDPNTCIYGLCIERDGGSICKCQRAYYTLNSSESDQCANSIQDAYPIARNLVRIFFTIAYGAACVIAATFFRRLSNQSRQASRNRFKTKYQVNMMPCCGRLREHVFGMAVIASGTRFLWCGLDPRGASFILHPRISSHEYPSHEERFSQLFLIRFFDYTLVSIGYVAYLSMLLAVVSFWVQVSLQFGKSSELKLRCWKTFFMCLEILTWFTFLVIALVLTALDQPILIVLYNSQVCAYMVTLWTAVGLAYRKIYRASAPKSGPGKSDTRSEQRQHARKRRNLWQITKLAMGTMSILTLAIATLIVATASEWTNQPLPYLIVVGVLYRMLEISYLSTFLYVLRAKRNSSSKKKPQAKNARKELRVSRDRETGKVEPNLIIGKDLERTTGSSTSTTSFAFVASSDRSTFENLGDHTIRNAVEQLEIGLNTTAVAISLDGP